MAIDLDALRKKHQELNKPKGSSEEFLKKFFQVQDGSNVIRILPGQEDKQFFSETKIHRVPTEDGKTRNFHCRRVFNEQCPLCELYFSLWKTGRKEDEDLARKIKPQPRFYLNVLDRNTGDVKILSTNKSVMNVILNDIFDEDIGDITDPTTGHDFKLHKVSDGPWPKYDQSKSRPKATPIGTEKEIAAVLEMRHDIHSLVKLEDYEEMKKVAETIAITGKISPTQASEESEEVSDENYLNKLKS